MTAVATPFFWRDRHGYRHVPARMETRHLFYTLRMIWNSTMPANARLPGNVYSFGPTYTKDYMLNAIAAIATELDMREDLTPDWEQQLQRMIDWLATHQLSRAESAQIAETT